MLGSTPELPPTTGERLTHCVVVNHVAETVRELLQAGLKWKGPGGEGGGNNRGGTKGGVVISTPGAN